MSAASAWLPPPASDVAASVDFAFEVTVFAAVFLAVVIVGLLAVFVLVFREREGGGGPASRGLPSAKLQAAWIAGPVLGCGALFVLGLPTLLESSVPRNGAYRVIAEVQPWTAEEAVERGTDDPPLAGWSFTYPNGYSARELHLPTDTEIRLSLRAPQSSEALAVDGAVHGLSLPALRLAGRARPGRETDLWFQATTPGTYSLVTTTYNGPSLAGMATQVVVEEPSAFEKWLQESADILSTLPPAEAGAIVYQRNACAPCHSIDGLKLVGPTFKGLWGKTETLEGGATVTVDIDYLRESIYEPAKKVVAGFQPVMPSFAGRITEEEIGYLAAYLESLSGKEE